MNLRKVLGFSIITAILFMGNLFTAFGAKDITVEERLLQLKELASQGKCLEFPFAIDTEKSVILADPQWGKPDEIRCFGFENAFYYNREQGVIGVSFNDNEKIRRIVQYFSDVELSDVKNVFGERTDAWNEPTATYQIGEYKLVFDIHWGFYATNPNEITRVTISK